MRDNRRYDNPPPAEGNSGACEARWVQLSTPGRRRRGAAIRRLLAVTGKRPCVTVLLAGAIKTSPTVRKRTGAIVKQRVGIERLIGATERQSGATRTPRSESNASPTRKSSRLRSRGQPRSAWRPSLAGLGAWQIVLRVLGGGRRQQWSVPTRGSSEPGRRWSERKRPGNEIKE